MNDAAAQGNRNRLSTVLGAQLIHEVFDVSLDGFFRDEELNGDILISVSAGNCAQHFDLAGG
jgi:hypothetical protein